MSAVSKFDIMFERVLERKLERKLDEYFASLEVLETGPVFQVHAAMTRKGLTKAARKTKRSQLADMKVNEEYFFKAPAKVAVDVFSDRWSSSVAHMQKKTGYKWSVHRDWEQGGAVIVRTR